MKLTWRHGFFIGAVVAASIAACSSFSGSDGSLPAQGDASAAPDGDAAHMGDGAISVQDSAAPSTDAGGDADASVVATRKRVFVTSSATPATFGRIQPARVAADQLCAQAATAIPDAGVFTAWISDGIDPAMPAAPGPYYDLTRTALVFNASGDFFSTPLRSEYNQPPAASWWTGMASPTQIGDTCGFWTGDASYAAVGKAASWFGGDGSAELPCMGGFAGILCFEQ